MKIPSIELREILFISIFIFLEITDEMSLMTPNLSIPWISILTLLINLSEFTHLASIIR